MPYIETQDESEIYFSDWGEGEPVVLIHGWPLDSTSWEYQAKFLADNGYRVIAYDRRGFGRSERPYDGYDYDTLTSDLNDLLEALDLTGVTLVGFSMGGGEVARYLATYGSERIAKAVFVGAVTPFLLKTEDNPDGIDASVFQGVLEGLQKDRFAFTTEFAKGFYGRTLLNHGVSDEVLQWHFLQAAAASPVATIECAKSWSSTDFREDLAKIDVPTLVLHGTGDKTVPIEISGRRTAALVPGAVLLEYEGEPHGFTATIPDQLNEDLLAFLRS